MSIQKLTEDLNIIAGLDNHPALTPTQLKAKFDEAANLIKAYINNTLLNGIDLNISDLNNLILELQNVLNNIDAEGINYDNTNSQLESTNLQSAIDELKTLITSLNTNLNSLSFAINNKVIYSDFLITTAGNIVSVDSMAELTNTISINNTGFFPIGIVGVDFQRTNPDVTLLEYRLTSSGNGTGIIKFKLKSQNISNTTSHYVGFDVLWVRIR